MKNARNQHRTDYAKELVKIVQTTKDREELKKKIAAYHERDIANAIVESDKTVRKCIYDILDIAEIAEDFFLISKRNQENIWKKCQLNRQRKLYQTWIQMMRWICLKN